MDFGVISVLVLDVDGVLTDGRLAFGADGESGKIFCVRDGWAIKCWQRASHRAVVLSGRRNPAVDRRAGELGITLIRQGVGDKGAAYRQLCDELGVGDENVCYVGDDWPDLPAMSRCGFPVAVANAAGAVKRVSKYVTQRRGGDGAVAEVIELVLRKQRRWPPALGS